MADVDHIILDQTAFYPQSGGQPSNTGLLQKEDVVFKVVCAKPPEPVHNVDKIDLEAGDRVHGKLDWDRRYRFMRSHTACHILSAVIFKETGSKIAGSLLTYLGQESTLAWCPLTKTRWHNT